LASRATIVCTRSVSSWRCGRAEVRDGLGELTQSRAIDGRLTDLRSDVAGEGAGIRLGELAGVVGEKALGNELEQHVVVALEGDVDVEVGAQLRETVLGEKARSAAGLAALLNDVERRPGAERLERGGNCLEILTILVGVMGAGEHAVEGGEEHLVCE
jgi:hypothetical protein